MDSSSDRVVAEEPKTVPYSAKNTKLGWRVDGRKKYAPVNQQGGMTGREAAYRLTPLEEQYVSFRIRGFPPSRSLQLVDQEQGRVARSRAFLYKEAAKLESRLGRYCVDVLPVEEFSEDEFSRYEDHLLEKIAMFPKESAAFALTAVREIRNKRLQRKTANDGAMIEWVKDRCEEVVRIAAIETWLEKRLGPGGRPLGGAFQGAGNDAGHAHRHPGKGAGGDILGLPATLEALSLVERQEREMLGVLERTTGRLREMYDDAAGVVATTTG